MRWPAREDLVLFSGLALLGWGLWQHYPPLGPIAVGLLLVLLAVPVRRWWL